MKKIPIVIAIDGPSASGKGTLAKKLATHFHIPFLSTGAIYRLVALRLIKQKIDPKNFEVNIQKLAANITESDLDNDELFTEEVGSVTSSIAKNQKLREELFYFQKKFVEDGKLAMGAVLDGRDTTTVICPDADFKFFVTADVEVRARRRFEQLKQKVGDVVYEDILSQLKLRDENDFNRSDSPLKIASDAIVIDNSQLSIEQGFYKILQEIETKK